MLSIVLTVLRLITEDTTSYLYFMMFLLSAFAALIQPIVPVRLLQRDIAVLQVLFHQLQGVLHRVAPTEAGEAGCQESRSQDIEGCVSYNHLKTV